MSFNAPYGSGGGGLFPYAHAAINWEHPLAANLAFFAVPCEYGYFDLVQRQPMPHQTPTGVAPNTAAIQLFGETPLRMAAWSYGNGTTTPSGAFARTLGSQPGYNSTSMTVAGSFWTFPYKSGYSGGTNRIINATCGTDANGTLNVQLVNTATGFIGGNAGTGSVNSDLTSINNAPLQVSHCVLASFDGTTLAARRDNALNSSSNQSARGPLANIDRIQIGDGAANNCGRPIFWGAMWKAALSVALANLVTAPDGVTTTNPNFGVIPRGLLLAPRRLVSRP